MIHKSFDTVPRAEIMVARDNLAEVAAFVFEDDQQDADHRFHVIGNLTLATAATAERLSPVQGIVEEVEELLTTGGLNQEKAAKIAAAAGKLSRFIFPLQHIPDDAPEIIIGKKSRELNVGKFVAIARGFNPAREPDPGISGFGNQMFIGSYLRKLS